MPSKSSTLTPTSSELLAGTFGEPCVNVLSDRDSLMRAVADRIVTFAQRAIAEETVNIASQFQRTGEVLNCVNIATHSSAQSLLLVRHRNRPGVLARVFRSPISKGG